MDQKINIWGKNIDFAFRCCGNLTSGSGLKSKIEPEFKLNAKSSIQLIFHNENFINAAIREWVIQISLHFYSTFFQNTP